MIEEQIDFVRAIEAVVDWVQAESNWDETLLIITADHETGLLWGPQSGTVPFDPIVDQGPGHLPHMRFNSKNHTNSLVPVYATGAGSENLAMFIVGDDPVRGPYVDNTGVAQVVLHAVADKPISPPPAQQLDACPAAFPAAGVKPDVLLIMPDQMRGDCLSILDHPVGRTPQLDQLAKQGALFRRTYTTVPACIPARHPLLTGLFPQTSGVAGFKYVWRPTDGSEQLFDLKTDPQEERDLSPDESRRGLPETWRSRLAQRLADRPEGFSDGESLTAGRPYRPLQSGVR